MDEVEALRRRLYRPDASEEDRARYALLIEPAAPEVAAAPEPRPGPRVPRTLVVAAMLLGLGVIVAIGRSVAAPAASAPAAVELPPAPTASTILPTQRVAVSIDGLAKTGLRVEGSGSAEVALDLADVSYDGGRFTVLLRSSDERPAGWTAIALETRQDWTSFRRAIASSPVRDRLAATRPDEGDYVGSPPTWIDVRAPADAVWTLTVALDDGRTALLH